MGSPSEVKLSCNRCEEMNQTELYRSTQQDIGTLTFQCRDRGSVTGIIYIYVWCIVWHLFDVRCCVNEINFLIAPGSAFRISMQDITQFANYSGQMPGEMLDFFHERVEVGVCFQSEMVG